MLRVIPLTQKDFYDEMGAIRGNAAANELLYLSAHTIYLKEGINYKKEFFKVWRENFGIRLSDEAWEYIWELYPSFVAIGIIEDLKLGKEISSELKRWQTLVRLEMDLKLIECAESGTPFSMESFSDFINQKYNFAFENILRDIESTDIPYIENFLMLGKALIKYKSKIKNIYDKFMKAHSSLLKISPTENKNSTSRVGMRRKNSKSRNEKVVDKPAEKISDKSAEKVEEKVETVAKNPPPVEEKVELPTTPPPADEETVKAQVIKDYETIIAEYEEKIKQLEKDVVEYQRRHDDIREYSVTQYDRGVRDLFGILNDKRYSKPIEYLYKIMNDKSLDENLRGYLENFFLALEEMDIEPIAQEGSVENLDATRLTANYNLEFDRKDFVPEKTAIKYVGWKYKNFILERPTLEKRA